MSAIKKVNVNGQEYDLVGAGGGSSQIVEITYSELKALVDSSSLIPETKYRITDFVTDLVDETSGKKSAKHAFDIIVRAISNSRLSQNAEARVHEGDDYFDNNIEVWELKYEFSSSTYKKGRITFLRDHYGNEASYDFKNIMFEGDDIVGGAGKYFYTFSGIDSYDTFANLVDLSQTGKVKNNKIKAAACIICSSKSTLGTYSSIDSNVINVESSVIITLGSAGFLPASLSWNTINAALYVKNLLGNTKYNIIDCTCAIEGGTGSSLPQLDSCKFLSFTEYVNTYVKFNGAIKNCVFFGSFNSGDTVNAADSVFITAKDNTVKYIDLFSLQ